MATHTLVGQIRLLRYTSMLLGRLATNNNMNYQWQHVLQFTSQILPQDPLFFFLFFFFFRFPQRSKTVHISSSVNLMSQNQPFSRGPLPNPKAWPLHRHHVSLFADVSRCISGRTEGSGLGFGHLVCTDTGKSHICLSFLDGHLDQIPCAQVDSCGLLGEGSHRCVFFRSPLNREFRSAWPL